MQTLRSAARHYELSSLIATRAVREARKAATRSSLAAAQVVAVHQITAATEAAQAVGSMLSEQQIDTQADALLNSLAFATSVDSFLAMVDSVGSTDNAEFDRLVESLVQDAARSAESVSTTVRADVYHVRYLSPPSCSRCAVLAGRVYRWSDGFQRHPNCDCVMIPTTVAAPYAQDPVELLHQGLITDLSKADAQAIRAGADFGTVVNVRRRQAGLVESGRVLSRAGKPSPEAIYRIAGSDREKAVSLLAQYGYVR